MCERESVCVCMIRFVAVYIRGKFAHGILGVCFFESGCTSRLVLLKQEVL